MTDNPKESAEECCIDPQGFYLGITCPTCKKSFRAVKGNEYQPKKETGIWVSQKVGGEFFKHVPHALSRRSILILMEDFAESYAKQEVKEACEKCADAIPDEREEILFRTRLL